MKVRTDPVVRRARLTLMGLLAAGWVLGLVIQVAIAIRTGWLDVFPPQMLLGVLLCVGAGSAARIVDPIRRSARSGAMAGIAMIVSIVLGYLVLVAIVTRDRSTAEGGETWSSLLLEAPFWIGIPLVTGAVAGAVGWRAADRVVGPSWPARPST